MVELKKKRFPIWKRFRKLAFFSKNFVPQQCKCQSTFISITTPSEVAQAFCMTQKLFRYLYVDAAEY